VGSLIRIEGVLTAISLKQSEQVFANTSASEHKEPKETQQRNIDVQVDGEIPLDSGRHAGEAWEQEVQDRGLSFREWLNWQGNILNVSCHFLVL
jgi:hypothetical protein